MAWCLNKHRRNVTCWILFLRESMKNVLWIASTPYYGPIVLRCVSIKWDFVLVLVQVSGLGPTEDVCMYEGWATSGPCTATITDLLNWRRRQNPVSETLCFEIENAAFLHKNRKMDSVQNHNIYTNVSPSQTFRSYDYKDQKEKRDEW
jgi:hypothetical protein